MNELETKAAEVHQAALEAQAARARRDEAERMHLAAGATLMNARQTLDRLENELLALACQGVKETPQ